MIKSNLNIFLQTQNLQNKNINYTYENKEIYNLTPAKPREGKHTHITTTTIIINNKNNNNTKNKITGINK